jgi:seryl-tRNA(Sec) selenium transferase
MKEDNILSELGIKKIINAAGHYTIFGGSQPSLEVNQIMATVSNYWVDMNELQKNAGHYLHSILDCEDGMVTSGAYSALIVATRASMLKRNVAKPQIVIQIPHITKYSEAFRAAGAELKEINRASESDSISNYIDDSTVALAYVISERNYEFSLSDTTKAAKDAGIPVIVDASLVDPPIKGIKQVLAQDPDLVAVSGGKGFNGPNNTGILLGKSSLLSSARDLSFPNYGIGRAMKVSKEQIVGILATIKIASEIDEDALVESWRANIDSIKRRIISMPDVKTRAEFPWNLNIAQPIPRLYISVGEGQEGASKAAKIREWLKNSNPPIITRSPSDTNAPPNTIVIEGRCLKRDDYDFLVERLNSNLERAMNGV